jgi:hypothetical protein
MCDRSGAVAHSRGGPTTGSGGAARYAHVPAGLTGLGLDECPHDGDRDHVESADAFGRRIKTSQCRQKVELRRSRAVGAAVEIDDLALRRPIDGAVGDINEACEALGMPVLAAGLTRVPVHALLHDRPLAVVGDKETVEVEIKAVLNGISTFATKRLPLVRACASNPTRSPSTVSSCGVRRECFPRPPQT